MNTEFFTFPSFDPIIFSLGPISLRWYGLMYLIGFLFARWLAIKRANNSQGAWNVEQVDNLLFNGFMGVFLGGRIGYVLFYQFDYFLQEPSYLFRVWEGGMSFHGGLIGVIISMIITSKLQKRSFWVTADFVAPLIPFGLGMGRIGNFINDELWGRVTDVSWAVLFPSGGYLPRHPSQLYEAFLEGLVLFFILNWFIKKPRATGSIAGLFLACYGFFRFIVEFFREPDPQLGLYFGQHISMGQILSLPMIIIGLIIIAFAYKSALKKG
ncbi:prolipoprotein diacylglyceryl transferase [Bisgaardia hudsonensis]|uniref:Phosphatidylglycerol--prolipoprotein diacylglyceryl transferase n=1 Tax=Bisgaardia hudsonensis TaxID=109472 RepID=A0A4R2N098_9PAST|nr:prolipoprotein diacylglyceryl transferase [Bisgaardia hudsonensis]QLB13385.1 prolipoprotein diacylglyceryl transferase [Bisgaardia hudsonensis]TCP12789.1 prolipoprotein diacylglyceryl transferase [Bisgaardia hudsonensis]